MGNTLRGMSLEAHVPSPTTEWGLTRRTEVGSVRASRRAARIATARSDARMAWS